MEAAVFSTLKDLCSRQGHTVDMPPEIHMPGPVCLIGNISGRLVVNQEALKTLSAFTQPLVVVAIVGPYRTGKSYLMNKLAGKKEGFPLGSTVKSKTKGIWMWCVPHPSKLNHTLVLLDTEGLGDVEKGDPNNDSWIFALAVLLSSMFVYNSMGTINHQALEQLHYVTELTKLIRTKSSPSSGEVGDSDKFVSFFPDFVWTVRDFMLELKLDERTITEDEYLENALKLIPGENPQIQKSNMPRKCIKKFFPTCKCFIFDRPMSDKKLLQHMDTVSENQLEWNFQEQSRNFCQYIFTHAKVKTLTHEITVTGNRLGTLVVTYVDTINSGAVPCLENAVTTLAELENSAAVQKAADHYSEQMAQRVSFPTDTIQELLDLHAACEREAIAIFMERSFKDDKWEFQKKLVDIIDQKKKVFLLQNEETSVKYCQAQLRQLSEPLLESISRGTFSVPGGYIEYSEEMSKIEHSYSLVPRKGVKASEVLQTFLQSQAATKESILQADKALSAEEKALSAERAKREALEKEQELLRQTVNDLQQKVDTQEKSLRENIAQLTEKMKREREVLQREQKRIEEHKRQVEETLNKHKENMAKTENKIEVQRTMIASLEVSIKMWEEMQKQNQQNMEEKEKNYQELLQQLNEKRVEERTECLAEQVRTLHLTIQKSEQDLKEAREEIKSQHQNEVEAYKASEVLQTFLQSQAATKESILQADQTLSAEEKALAAERAKREALEKEQELLRQTVNDLQQKVDTQEKSFRENIAQLTEKMKREREVLQRDQKRIEEHKRQVEETLNEHKENIAKTEKEIEVQRTMIASLEVSIKMWEEMQKQNQQNMEEKEKNYQELLQQLNEKRVEERTECLAEQVRTLHLTIQDLKEAREEIKSQHQNEVEVYKEMTQLQKVKNEFEVKLLKHQSENKKRKAEYSTCNIS